MKISLRIFVITVVTVLSIFIYTGCGCACGEVQEADIPSDVIKNANKVIINKTGQDFFEKYVTLDLRRSKVITPDYFMVYRLIMPDKPYVNETMEFTVDAQGNLNKSFSVSGIPECSGGGCDFPINDQGAIDIAEQNGFKKGTKGLKAGFNWSEKYNRYVWDLISVEEESPSSISTRSSGTEIIIDGNTGEVLNKNDWHVR